LSADQAQVEKQCYAETANDPAGLKPCGVADVKRTGSGWRLTQ
jgi:hypothetical protein